jgi:outer membrane receptor protein involved in Fe transport
MLLIVDFDRNYAFSDKIRFSTGYNGNFNRADYSYQNETTGYADVVKQNENRHSAYVSISLDAAKFSLQSGLRYEFSDIRLAHGYDTVNLYNFLLPAISALYKPGKKSSFRLTNRKSVTRPGINLLCRIRYTDDSYQQSVGNPNLKPAYTNRVEFTHRVQLSNSVYVSYRPYISFIKNDIRLVNLPVSDTLI